MINNLQYVKKYIVLHKDNTPYRFFHNEEIVIYNSVSEAIDDANIINGYVMRVKDLTIKYIINELTKKFENNLAVSY